MSYHDSGQVINTCASVIKQEIWHQSNGSNAPQMAR